MNFSTNKRKPGRPEAQLQKACVTYFRYRYPHLKWLMYASANGGTRNVIEAANLKAQGVLSGVSDLFISVPSGGKHGFYIELKAGKNVMSDAQVAFSEAVTAYGYEFALVYTFDQFKDVVQKYLKE